MNSYYFALSLRIFEDIDIYEVENKLGIKATKLTTFKNSLGENKCAKLYLKTKEYSDVYTDEIFAKFVKTFSDKQNLINDIQNKYKTELIFSIVFTSLKEKPCLSLSNETINLLSNMNAKYDVDFI